MKSKEYNALPKGTKVLVSNFAGTEFKVGIVCKRSENFRKGWTQYSVVSIDGYNPTDIAPQFISLPREDTK